MEQEIESKLGACDIFLLLISSHSLSSDLVREEIAVIRERHAKGEDVYFYALLLTPMGNTAPPDLVGDNLRPRDGKPLSAYSTVERAKQMSAVANEIAEVAQEIAVRKTKSAPEGVSGFSPDNTAGPRGPDILGIDADARALARLMCLEGASPLAIAVLGGWGSGKSSFMERLDWEVRKIARPKDPPRCNPPTQKTLA